MWNAFVRTKGSQPGGNLPAGNPEKGFLFAEYVALALILSLQRKMEDAGMPAGRGVIDLLDELDLIEARVKPGGKPVPLRLQDTMDQTYLALGLEPMK